MNTKLVALAVAGALASPLFVGKAVAADSPHSFSGNVALVSNYVFRGISQSAHKPAIQGGFDYEHASGFYVGTWASNVSWVSDNYEDAAAGISASNSLELDVYGGYKGAFNDDWGFDVGLIRYNYPGSRKTVGGTFLKPDTTEVYGSINYKWITLKYSRSTTALFGWGSSTDDLKRSKGSGYLELNAEYELGDGWGISGHIGRQRITRNSPASYTDYSIGVTKDVGFGVVGFAYNTSNSKGSCSKGQAYCWGGDTGKSYNAGKSTAVLSFSKDF